MTVRDRDDNTDTILCVLCTLRTSDACGRDVRKRRDRRELITAVHRYMYMYGQIHITW